MELRGFVDIRVFVRRVEPDSIKPGRFEMSSQWFGSRVLDDRAGVDRHVMAMPRDAGRGTRDAGLAYPRPFIEDAKFDGRVKASIERLEMRGALVAPLE